MATAINTENKIISMKKINVGIVGQSPQRHLLNVGIVGQSKQR